MAGALLGVMEDNLRNFLVQEFVPISGIRGIAVRLSDSLLRIKGVLEDAEEKVLKDRAIQVWLQELKDTTYMLDDILDEYFIRSHKIRGLSLIKPNNIIFRHKIIGKLQAITDRFDYLVQLGGAEFGLEFRRRSGEMAEFGVFWQTTSVIDPFLLREDDKERILEFLLTQSYSSNSLFVLTIVGLGGIGKTTLAQLVCDSLQVSNHFDIKIWVHDCKDLSIKKILCFIIDYFTKEKYDVYDLDVIERKVQVLLQNRRYFLVLDDVWNAADWNKLIAVLSRGNKGSCILVTTRSMEVAESMGTCPPYALHPLRPDDCWALFRKYAFGPDREEHAELEEIGKQLLIKCGGVPLAVRALGDLLRSKGKVDEWYNVLYSWIWDYPGDENSILPILRLSYFHLTPTAKQCFAFCALFPKNTEIMAEDLIHLWIANGFVSSKLDLEVEDVGRNIWNELYQKSFFKDVKLDDCSVVISFKMHDLFHDLAQSVMKEECVILENADMTELSENTHHIAFGSSLISFNKGAFNKVESLRTLYQLEFAFYNTISGCFPTNRSLRVLRTSYFPLSSLKNLIHLRYLELYGFEIEALPDSIYNLQKLEILKLTSCHKLRCLPKHLACLENLRHLVISDCHSLSCMFPDIGKLNCLRTLSLFIVSLKTGHSLAELHDLKLGGKLRIEGLQNVGSLREAQEANLLDKTNLHELCFSWDNSGETKPNGINAEQVLEALQPHQNLGTLRIYNYEGLHLPSWIGILHNLLVLELFDCTNCLQLPPLGELRSLIKLEIYSMDNVQHLDKDGVEMWPVFPSLKELEVRGLPNLERLLKVETGKSLEVETGKSFPRLSSVIIDDCSKLRFSCLPCVERLTIRGCNDELLKSISSFNYLTFLSLSGGEDLASFPEEMMRNLICLKTLVINNFPKLKELPHELGNLHALDHLHIRWCSELESLSIEVEKRPPSLQFLEIAYCRKLRSLPEGFQFLEMLEVLRIECCPELEKRCKEGTGEDWDKIAHVENVILVS